MKTKSCKIEDGSREVMEVDWNAAAKTCGSDGVDEVTPDPMMTCPSCGHHFRVGRRLGGKL